MKSQFLLHTAGCLVAVAMILVAGGLHAQADAQRPQWVTPEHTQPEAESDDPAVWVPLTPPDIPMTPERMTEVRVLEYGARSEDPAQKMAAVRRIELLHQRGELEPMDREIMGVLHFVATEGVSTTATEGARRIAIFPQVRMHAIRTLGNVGGPYARSTVLEVIRYDTEPLVLSEATTALARMQAETNQELIVHLTNLIERMRRTTPSNRLAYSILAAIEDLNAGTTGIRDPSLFRAVITLTQSPYSAQVQRKALHVIDILRSDL